MKRTLQIILASFICTNVWAEETPLTPASVIEASTAADWRTPAPENLLHMQLPGGEVVFELAPDFAPQHVENLRKLVADKYFDQLAVIRSQDNYVAQWGDPNSGTDEAKSMGKAAAELEPEFYRTAAGAGIVPIISRDPYADIVGFAKGFAAGADSGTAARAWLTHCYGALGVGRGMAANSGNASQLYVVTGHAPRHLDRNVTLIGRALSGMEHLSSLPRGTGTLGFYETPEEAVTITSIRLGSELPAEQQSTLEVMRTDTQTFRDYVQSRTYRLNEWFLDKTGKIGVCNVGVPVREASE